MERNQTTASVEPITSENWRDSLLVEVHDSQLRFVADHQPVALVIMAKCYVRPSGADWTAWLLRDAARTPVGVFALVVAAEHCLLINFAIDHREQRRGLGAAAVALIIDHVEREHPAVTAITLTVHPDNLAAQGLYRAAGFAPTGDMSDGEPVWRREL